MGKTILSLVLLSAMLLLCGCTQDAYTVALAIPPGDGSTYTFSDQELSPVKDRITVSAGAGIAGAEILLEPVDGGGAPQGPFPLTQETPVKLALEEGVWYRIGVALPNDARGPVAVELQLEDVHLRIE